jgi:hypothetical protein
MKVQALEEMTHATNGFLQWFVTEQVEEKASANEVVQKSKLMGVDRCPPILKKGGTDSSRNGPGKGSIDRHCTKAGQLKPGGFMPFQERGALGFFVLLASRVSD